MLSLEERIQSEQICLQRRIIDLQEAIIVNSQHYSKKLEEVLDNGRKTYAQACDNNKTLEIKSPNVETKYSILLKSNTLKAEDIKMKLQKNINLTKMKVGINGIKKIGDQKMIISCQKKEEAEILTEEINKVIGKEINAEEIKKKNLT